MNTPPRVPAETGELSRACRFCLAALNFAKGPLLKLVFAYLLLLGVSAFLGQWTPEFLQGRTMWHFYLARMVIPMIMLGVFAAFIRLFPASLLLAASLLFIGTISAIKRDSTGEPFQVSDLFLAGQSTHLLGYVSWDRWLMGALIIPAALYAAVSLRFRRWSIPLFAVCVGLLSTYRFESVVQFMHVNDYWLGIQDLPFNQAASERMNGIGTHLYFSSAGLRLHNFTDDEVKTAMNALDGDPPTIVSRSEPPPDVFIILGEAWWRDPSDPHSPIDTLTAAGFAEAKGISPVYGGNTPNSEFEVLTGIPIHSMKSGIIPYQHYVQYFSQASRALPRMMTELGYTSRAYHNFDPRFWLRDKVYPLLGFASFDSQNDMKLTVQPNGWPLDAGLYADVLSKLSDDKPQFDFLVTVQTHGPFVPDAQGDMLNGEENPGMSDYHNRLAGATQALADFDQALKKRGKPYVLIVFGDHLPGIREHQTKIGIKTDDDPRLHQIPVLISSNSEDINAIRDFD
ncbi:LTA synthase family protein [Aestuariivirga sp.]|uniref:LTA synthase family protein n=1 Tax=Aestuariivirga sp. TaxID=2650926 RepID=UPI0039E7179B